MSSEEESQVVLPGRRLELDFLRGLALLVVLVDHLEARGGTRLIGAWTPISLGFSDGAEAFVFLSGLVFGIVSLPRLRQQGFWAVQKGVLRRAFTIYLTFLCATWCVLSIEAFVHPFFTGRPSPSVSEEGVFRFWFWSLSMCFQPYCLEILAFYAVLLPFTALLLRLYERCWYAAWGLSVGLYLIARHFESFQLPRFPDETQWYFNPLAWQFVFFLGFVCSQADPRFWQRKSVKRVATAIALAVLLISLRIRWSSAWPPELELLGSSFHDWISDWRDKSRLSSIRILHFLCLAYIVSRLIPCSSSKVWQSQWLSPIVKAGQHSLQVYAFGVVVLYLCFPILDRFRGSPVWLLSVALDCCLLSLGFAYFVSWMKATWKSLPRSELTELT